MKAELQKMINQERKHARELKELRDLRAKHMQHKVPDKGILEMIDKEIAIYLETK